MTKRFGYKEIVFCVLLIVPIIFMTMPNSYAGECPGGGKISGKAMDAVFTATLVSIDGDGDGCYVDYAVVTIVGSCNKQPVLIAKEIGRDCDEDLICPATLDTLTADQLGSLCFQSIGPAGCYSANGGEDLVITTVRDFNKVVDAEGHAVAIGARVSLQVQE